jgi:hypothetical protein
MKYYQIEDKLYQLNPETKVVRLRNTTEKVDLIQYDEFVKWEKREIKKQDFSRLMNEYFRDVKHHWEYDGKKFRKMDNFEKKGYSLSANYELGKQVPYHKLEKKDWLGNLILVYHWGRIYYHTISYNGEGVGQLVCPRTYNLLRWCRLKHCSPVFCITDKRIC